jgi:nucleotide-binding universal stress UspA family protein
VQQNGLMTVAYGNGVPARRYKIVVGVDLTEYCEIVLEHALDQAARHHAPELHFLYVHERDRKRSTEELYQRLSAIVYPALQEFNRYGSDWRARLHIRRGKAHEQIAILAQDIRADLIVIGQFGLHNPKQTFKTLPNRILQAAPCPTLVVGMPQAADEKQCEACASMRDATDGNRWFCEDHAAPDRVEHVMSPMTVWTGGSLMW